MTVGIVGFGLTAMAGRGPKMIERDDTSESRLSQTLKDAEMMLHTPIAVGQTAP